LKVKVVLGYFKNMKNLLSTKLMNELRVRSPKNTSVNPCINLQKKFK